MKQNYDIDDTFLARWLNNELTEDELLKFKSSEDYHLYKKIANKSTLFKIPEFNEEESFRKLQNKLSNQKTKVRKLFPAWVYGAAAAVLLMIGFSYFTNNTTDVICGYGEQLAYTLPDGSEVLLNGDTQIHFREKQWKKNQRILELEGEGYFKVKKGSTFSVKTNEGIVTVLGTQFNVQTAEQFLAVECYEGKVSVKNNSHSALLTPGKGIKLIHNKKNKYNINHEYPNWTVGIYDYDSIPLSVVFKDLENVYQIKVKNKNVDLTQIYTGKLIKNNLEKALKVICKPMNIQYSVDKDFVTIFE